MTDEHNDDIASEPLASGTPNDPDAAGGDAQPRKRRRRKKKRRPMAGQGTVAPTPTRHQARILALQALYEYDLTGHDSDQIADRMHEDEDVPPNVRAYASTLFTGSISNLDTIDSLIGAAATAFPVPQLPAVDRNVLRIAIYELTEQRGNVPERVVVNEAIEIAKNFGAENSGRFVHGVLGTITRRLAETPPTAEQA